MNSNFPAPSYLQHTPGDNQLANLFCQSSASHQVRRFFFLAMYHFDDLFYQPVEQRESTGDLLYIQPQPDLAAPFSPTHHTITPPVTTKKNRWQCIICPKSFTRRQERNRHELSHVPCFLHCPLPHCAWRGRRAGLFRKHWEKEDHRSYHEHYGRTPRRSQIQTFDPWMILNQIISGDISSHEGEVQAILLVQAKACELQKPAMWMDPWGGNNGRMMRQQTQFRLIRPALW